MAYQFNLPEILPYHFLLTITTAPNNLFRGKIPRVTGKWKTLRTTTRTREGQEDEHGLADLHLVVRHGFEAVERVEERWDGLRRGDGDGDVVFLLNL